MLSRSWGQSTLVVLPEENFEFTSSQTLQMTLLRCLSIKLELAKPNSLKFKALPRETSLIFRVRLQICRLTLLLGGVTPPLQRPPDPQLISSFASLSRFATVKQNSASAPEFWWTDIDAQSIRNTIFFPDAYSLNSSSYDKQSVLSHEKEPTANFKLMRHNCRYMTNNFHKLSLPK